jgi:dCMP deaminase
MDKLDQLLMKTAQVWAAASYCERSKVGCVIARDGRIIATGYNGTLPGEENTCEDCSGATKSTVMHAEQNALIFCAKHGLSVKGCVLYTTLSPCMDCVKSIISSGITRVVYLDEYRDTSGIALLKRFNITTEKIDVS